MPRLETDPPLCPDGHDWDDLVILSCRKCYEPADIGEDACSRGLMEVAREQQRERQTRRLVAQNRAKLASRRIPARIYWALWPKETRGAGPHYCKGKP